MLKSAHIGFAFLSITLFFIRGIWMMTDSAMLQKKIIRILPHVVDTLLLVTAIILLFQIDQYPLQNAWLTAKVLALVAYIGVGLVAMRLGRTKVIRIVAWVIALDIFAYIYLVAITRNPLPFLS